MKQKKSIPFLIFILLMAVLLVLGVWAFLAGVKEANNIPVPRQAPPINVGSLADLAL
ncbi:MAG: hypothetical protein FWF47_05685 [Clostridia bacterium]|nr:hypothetical protein [Clostridia bacterium]